RTEQRTDLRDRTACADLRVKEMARPAASGEHRYLIGDARAGRIDEVHHRNACAVSEFGDADHLFDAAGTPRSSLDRRVVREDADLSAVDRGCSRDAAG